MSQYANLLKTRKLLYFEVLKHLTFHLCSEYPQSNTFSREHTVDCHTRFIMCFGSSSSRDKYPPPRRVEYVRDYDTYHYAKKLENDRKKAKRRARNTAAMVASIGASGGGGGGC